MERRLKVSKPIDPTRLKGVGDAAFKSAVELVKTMNQALAPYRGAKSSCWVCRSDHAVSVAQIHGIEFVQCQDCSHVYQSHVIPYEILRDYFADDTDINVHVADGQFEYRIEHLSRPKVEVILDVLKELGRPTDHGRWLDCACGSGDMLYAIRERGWSGVGFDIGKAGVQIARKAGLAAHACDLDGFLGGAFREQERSEPFDVVTAFGYLDVLTDPTEARDKLRSMIRPGGLFVMHQPHFNSVTHDLNRRFPEHAIRYLNAGQRSSFTRQSLERFLGDGGMEIVLEWRFGLDMYNLIALMALRLPGFEDTLAYQTLLARFDEMQHQIDAEGRNDTMMVVARCR